MYFRFFLVEDFLTKPNQPYKASSAGYFTIKKRWCMNPACKEEEQQAAAEETCLENTDTHFQ